MGEPISTKKLGGVTYNANQFTGRELGNGQFELKAKNGGEKLIFPRQSDLRTVGYETKYYTPDGKEYTYQRYGMDGLESFDGQKLTKKDIPIYGERNAKIELNTHDHVMYDDNHFTISEMMEATFSSSKDTVAHVKLENCESTTVDLAANRSRWYGDSANIKGGQNNRVILDNEDSAKINDKPVKGEGIADQKDYE